MKNDRKFSAKGARNEKVHGMVRNIMNKALAACGGEKLWSEWSQLAVNRGLSEVDLCLGDAQGDLAARLEELKVRTPKKDVSHVLRWKIDFIRQQAAALCYLVDYSQSGKGIRATVFPEMKGVQFREAARIAGRQLWEDSGEKEGEQFAVCPIIFDDDGPEDTGLFIGRRFFRVAADSRQEDGIDGLTPPLPTCALREQLVLARVGEMKAFGGKVKKTTIYLGVAPGYDWKACVERIARMIKAQKA
jgi:hypothetical protein